MANLDWKNLNVILVEDNRYMGVLMQAILRSAGVRNTRILTDGASALEELKVYRADLALVDVVMDGLDGLEFAKIVRNDKKSEDPFLPIILVSAYNDVKTIRAAIDAGANDFIAKPLVPATLLTRVARALLAPRPFVRTRAFFGPNRRRTRTPLYRGEERRTQEEQDASAGHVH
ncbi:MAG: response regulator [Alphaproteobacteria bacterium]|nr:response regulator [Alphaproteobacteria bacterium]